MSRERLADILEGTEENIDRLETQLGLVGRVAEANQLQSQSAAGGS